MTNECRQLLIRFKGENFPGHNPDQWYTICGYCREYIDNTWDHQNWCISYEPDALVKWLEDND